MTLAAANVEVVFVPPPTESAEGEEGPDEGLECLSIFIPNARDSKFPPSIGDMIRYPQFSAKWAVTCYPFSLFLRNGNYKNSRMPNHSRDTVGPKEYTLPYANPSIQLAI
jgi:hypothetical protein